MHTFFLFLIRGSSLVWGSHRLVPLIAIRQIVTLFLCCATAPIVNIVPPVATILPEHEEVVLRCETNSERLPVLWVANNLITELSPATVYRVPIPPSGFPDLTSFTCIVRNPEIDDPSTTNIVGRADAYVRNLQGM